MKTGFRGEDFPLTGRGENAMNPTGASGGFQWKRPGFRLGSPGIRTAGISRRGCGVRRPVLSYTDRAVRSARLPLRGDRTDTGCPGAIRRCGVIRPALASGGRIAGAGQRILIG
jgi:hypothetical protein